jgi:hypothetical protein
MASTPAEKPQGAEVGAGHRVANSFKVVARERLGKYSVISSESRRICAVRRFDRDVVPRLCGRPIAEISPPELLDVLRRIENRGAVDTHTVSSVVWSGFPIRCCDWTLRQGYIPRSARRIATNRGKPLCSSNQA